jgi:hypothetical protein
MAINVPTAPICHNVSRGWDAALPSLALALPLAQLTPQHLMAQTWLALDVSRPANARSNVPFWAETTGRIFNTHHHHELRRTHYFLNYGTFVTLEQKTVIHST